MGPSRWTQTPMFPLVWNKRKVDVYSFWSNVDPMTESSSHEKAIAVFQGGPTGEHPISLKTGEAARKALSRLGYAPLPVLVEKSGKLGGWRRFFCPLPRGCIVCL